MKRRHSLSVFIFGAGLLPVLLLCVASLGTRIAARELRDVNQSGSLRFRSVWLYGATHTRPAEDWRPMWAQMESIRRRLRTFYPADVARTDAAWNVVSEELARTNCVDWQSANALCEACNRLTDVIEQRARAEALRASLCFTLGLVGMIALLIAGGRLARRTEEAERAQQCLTATLEATPDFVGMADAHGNITYLNAALRRLMGRAPDAPLAGLKISDSHPPSFKAQSETHIQPALRAHGFWTGETTFLAADGREVPVSQTILAHKNADGDIERFSTIARDMTEARQTVRDLEENRALFAASVEALQEGFVVQDGNGVALLCNSSAERMLGLAVGGTQGHDVTSFGWRVTREDGSDWPRAEHPSRVALSSGQPQRDKTIRLEKEGVAPLFLEFSAYPLFRAGETVPYAALTLFQDITAKKEAEDALRRAEQKYHSIFENAIEGILQGTPEGRIVSANPALARILGYDNVPHLMASVTDIGRQMYADPADRERLLALIRQHGSAQAFEAPLRRRDGGTVWVSMNVRSVRDERGELRYLEGTLEDITERRDAAERLKDYSIVLEFQKAELEKANAELETLATTDGLTGLLNPRTFGKRLAEACTASHRYGTPLSLIMLDVDYFKQYNDRFGHPAGDAVLQQVGRILGGAARATDLAARYGGEEFVVILPHTDARGAMVLAERIRAAMEDADWPRQPVTVSVGVSTLRPEMDSPAALVQSADDALYASKQAGRNRVTQNSARAACP